MDIYNNLKNIVQWCNENQGFANLLLSALTLLTSIIAIWVSVHTARLPYKKKLLLKAGNYIGASGEMGIYISVTNIGNRNVKLQDIGLSFGNQNYINIKMLPESQIMLSQGELTQQYYNIDDFKNKLISLNVNPSVMIKAYVKDSEGKNYKKNFTKVKTILKQSTYIQG